LFCLVQGLLLALRMWPHMPVALLQECGLLPAGSPRPPAALFAAPTPPLGTEAASAPEPEPAPPPLHMPAPLPASAAFFAPAHLEALSDALASSSASHPRMHSVWPTLFALLLPGFMLKKVRARDSLGSLQGVHICSRCPDRPAQYAALLHA
jgi:DNA polymerase phi